LALLAAGIFASLDQIFSRNWARFAKAEASIKLIRQLLEFDKRQIELAVPDDATAATIFDRTSILVRKVHVDVGEIVATETAGWSSNLEDANKELLARIKSSGSEVESALRKAESESKDASNKAEIAKAEAKPGDVLVRIGRAKVAAGTLEITVGDHVRRVSGSAKSVVIGPVPSGRQLIKFRWSDTEGKSQEQEDVVVVAAGGQGTCEFID